MDRLLKRWYKAIKKAQQYLLSFSDKSWRLNL
jgi:hypothetical protein